MGCRATARSTVRHKKAISHVHQNLRPAKSEEPPISSAARMPSTWAEADCKRLIPPCSGENEQRQHAIQYQQHANAAHLGGGGGGEGGGDGGGLGGYTCRKNTSVRRRCANKLQVMCCSHRGRRWRARRRLKKKAKTNISAHQAGMQLLQTHTQDARVMAAEDSAAEVKEDLGCRAKARSMVRHKKHSRMSTKTFRRRGSDLISGSQRVPVQCACQVPWRRWTASV